MVLMLVVLPVSASAGFWSIISNILQSPTQSVASVHQYNSQNIALLQATVNSDPVLAQGGGDITIVNDTALMPEAGPSGTMADITSSDNNGHISVYVVHKGDTLSQIAKMFDVSVNTIVWNNDIKSGLINEGQTLIILPITGVNHIVTKGETLQSIAKKYKGDVNEIMKYNNLSADSHLAIGDTVIIPDGEMATVPISTGSSKTTTSPLRGAGGPDFGQYYMRPVIGGYLSQGLHGYNAVDLATNYGSPIFAAAGGLVIVAKEGGWNGGYGSYVVISHPNDTQTLYAHMSNVLSYEGQAVVKGQVIGYVGTTGKSTGPHVHFEVRGAKNPFAN